MAMFDWNDEELTNVIWDKSRESDDHIVPYPKQNEEKHLALLGDASKQEIHQETSYAIPTEPNKPAISTKHGVESVTSSKYGILNSLMGFGLNSWPDSSDASSINVDPDQDSSSTALANGITSSKETGQFNKGSDFFQNLPEDREQSDFVDYGWENIGSFDDLDRIFSNNRPIFGDMSVGNLDAPWSSSKDVTSGSASRIIPTSCDSYDLSLSARTSSERSDVKAECMLNSSQSFVSVHQMLDKVSAQAREDEQGNKQKRLLKGKKLKEKSEVKQLHEIGSTWSSSGNSFHQVNNQYSSSMVNPGPPSVLSRQMQFQSPKPFQEKHLTYPPLSSHLYGNMVYHYPSMSVLPQFHPMEGNHKPGNQNSLKKPVDATVKPPTMTPKEKIEKLRRRQQLRAILAIQKQQQQLGNQVSVVEHSNIEGDNTEGDENLSSLPSPDPSTSIEIDDTNAVSIPFDNCLLEESALYQLQETISKLDNRIRLCIRDSLFRLAQSAIQRQCPSSTSSVNTSSRDDFVNTSSRDDFVSNKNVDTHERFMRIPVVETDTNPIDRTVAHLLFHRPLELSAKLVETPNSPVYANLPCDRKANTLKSSAIGRFPDCFENAHFDKDQSKNSFCLNTFEHTSNKEAVDDRC